MSTKRGENLYRNTEITDFYLDVWNPTKIQSGLLDKTITIDARYDRRPDLLSYDIYGTSKYWWVFMIRNKDVIFDPINDFKAGIEIRLPSLSSIEGV